MIKFLKVFITKIFLFFPILYFASFITCAQDIVAPKDTSYWKNEVQLGANFNQASFSNNWKAGGVNSVSLSGLFRGVANYEKDKTTLRHDLQMDYGFLKNDGQTSRKTLDRLYFDNKVGHKIADKLDAFASVNLITQFASGFKYEKDPVTLAEKAIYQSKFFSPAYVIEAAGIEYRPYKYLNIRVGLGGLRHTFVVDTSLYQSVPKNYGVAIGSMVRTQAIFNLVVD